MSEDDYTRNIWIHVRRILPNQRAYYAGQALAGLCAGIPDRDPASMAEKAVNIADALIAALQEGEPDKD